MLELVKSSNKIEDNSISKHRYIQGYSWPNITSWIKIFNNNLKAENKGSIISRNLILLYEPLVIHWMSFFSCRTFI